MIARNQRALEVRAAPSPSCGTAPDTARGPSSRGALLTFPAASGIRFSRFPMEERERPSIGNGLKPGGRGRRLRKKNEDFLRLDTVRTANQHQRGRTTGKESDSWKQDRRFEESKAFVQVNGPFEQKMLRECTTLAHVSC